MIIIMYYNNFLFFHLQITVKKHTMVCKACNLHVHNTNDMTLLHLMNVSMENLMMIIVVYKITCIVLVVKL